PIITGALVALAANVLFGQRGPRDPHGAFEGIWNSATATPLERPRELKDKPFFTPAEAADWERRFVESNEEPSPQAAAKNVGTGTYNTVYREFGRRTAQTLRTRTLPAPPAGR